MTAEKRPSKRFKKQIKEMDQLVAGVDPKAKLPRGFAFYSWELQLAWLRQHQLTSDRRT